MATVERRGVARLGPSEVAYVFKRVPRRRHVHLLVNDEGMIEVRAPWCFSLDQAGEALRENAEWVLATLRRARASRARRPRLITGACLPFLDESLRLDVRPRAQLDLFATRRPRRGRVERRGTLLRVSVASLDRAELRKLLKDWYRAQAADHVARRIAHYGPRLGVRPRRVSIRDQRLQWGSCSSAGAINLNWRLMLTPGELADYVIVHELCHLRHLDHSARFWALVSEVIPDHQRRRRALDALQDCLPL